MTEKKLPNEIGARNSKKHQNFAKAPNAVRDPQMEMRLRKKRHLSGLMCPPVGSLIEGFSDRKNH